MTTARIREAEELVEEAGQASILGDHDRARVLLNEAAGLNPASGDIAFRLARALDELDRPREARQEYCRYLALEPESPDEAEVRERITRLGEALDLGPPESALRAFREGVDALEGERYREALDALDRALEEHPDWPEGHYNRALAHGGLGAEDDAIRDLERYLELAPDAPDRGAVRDAIRQIAVAPVPARSPRTAFTAGLLVPGMGQVYTGRVGTGMAVLGLVGASAAAGLLYTRVDVTCRAVPEDGHCPDDQVLSREEDRPLLLPGLAAAGVATVVGAVFAYRSARSGDSAARLPRGGADLALEVPVGDRAVRVLPEVGVGSSRTGVGVRVFLRSGPAEP